MSHNRLVRRLVLPATPLALAGVSASSAEAAIVYTDNVDTTISAASGRIYWDMGTGGGTGSVSNTFFPASDMALFFGQNDSYVPDINHPAATVIVGYSYLATNGVPAFATKFAYGATISGLTGGPGTASSAEMSREGTGNWLAGAGQGYLGFRFDADGSGPGNTFLYGWARASYNSDKSLTLYDFAYESSGAPINAGAGAIPEPSSCAALAGLLAGSAALFQRRRRQ